MKLKNIFWLSLSLVALLPAGARAGVHVQCPGDLDGDAVIDVTDPAHPRAACMHLTAGDGFVTMADGRALYMFGFADVTGMPEDMVMDMGMLSANAPAPTIALDEGDEFYLSLTNVGMMMRPDLFDPHTVHWHGFPQAAPVFDGVPDSSISIRMGSTLTYYYKVNDAGTYMYHCHVEATEHIEMGMFGNLYVRPAQNRLPDGTVLGTHVHANPDGNAPFDNPLVGDTYAYNDGDGSTRYDVEYVLQIGGFDSDFHDASETIQPLGFAAIRDRYVLLNGRSYPDTINPDALPPQPKNGGKVSQPVSSLIEAAAGERILLRISSLDVYQFLTLASVGIPMTVIAESGRLRRTRTGENLYYRTSSVTLGGGESTDVILDTTGIPAGTYFLYTPNLNYLSNNEEDFGGLMTEIRID